MPITHTAQKLSWDKSQPFFAYQHMWILCLSQGFNQKSEIQD